MYFLKELLNVFFPDLCLICENNLTYNEETLCTYCRVDLPFTNFSSESNNIAERTFYGRIKLESVTSLLFYRKKGKVKNVCRQFHITLFIHIIYIIKLIGFVSEYP